MQIDSVLCICTGNICRSPLAEGLFRKRAQSLRVASAGIGAVVAGTMPDAAANIATREHLDLDSHRGKQVTRPMLQQHDLVMVMEAGQKQWLVANYPESRGRVFLLTHWISGDDIADPYRLNSEVFEQVYSEIEAGVDSWVARLKPAIDGRNRTAG